MYTCLSRRAAWPVLPEQTNRWGWFLRLQNFLQENYKTGNSKKKEVERGAGVSLDEDDRLVRTKDGWVSGCK